MANKILSAWTGFILIQALNDLRKPNGKKYQTSGYPAQKTSFRRKFCRIFNKK